MANALSGLAVVAYSAGVTVHTLPGVQGCVGASFSAGAAIVCAGVLVIAEFQKAAIYQCRFIDVAVAIVVDSVTAFVHRNGCVTVGESSISADPFPGAGSKFRLHCAGGPESEGNCLVGAGADARICSALHGGYSIDGFCFRTGEA